MRHEGDSYKRAGQQPAVKQCRRDADGSAEEDESSGLPYDQLQKAIARGAESEPYSHLLCAPAYRISENSKHARRGKDHSKHCKTRDKEHDQPTLSQEIGAPSIHGFHVEDRLLMIDSSHGFTHGICKRARISVRAQNQVEFVRGNLVHGHINLRLKISGESVVPDICGFSGNARG